MGQPYKCPVCEGKGYVGAGFYGAANSALQEKCRTCGGWGAIFPPEPTDAVGNKVVGEKPAEGLPGREIPLQDLMG